MDIVITVVFCIVAKIMLLTLQLPRKPKKKRKPAGALLFGNWYYWYKVNHASTNHQ